MQMRKDNTAYINELYISHILDINSAGYLNTFCSPLPLFKKKEKKKLP